MSRFFDENALAILGLCVIACWSLAVKIDPTSAPIISNVVSGLLGFVARSATMGK